MGSGNHVEAQFDEWRSGTPRNLHSYASTNNKAEPAHPWGFSDLNECKKGVRKYLHDGTPVTCMVHAGFEGYLAWLFLFRAVRN